MWREPKWDRLTQEELDGLGWSRRSEFDRWWYRNGEWAASCIVFVLALGVAIGAWAWQISTITEDRVREAASNAGLRDVDIGEFAYMECSDSDAGGYEITGTVADGRRVSAVVCCGAWKRCTVRW